MNRQHKQYTITIYMKMFCLPTRSYFSVESCDALRLYKLYLHNNIRESLRTHTHTRMKWEGQKRNQIISWKKINKRKERKEWWERQVLSLTRIKYSGAGASKQSALLFVVQIANACIVCRCVCVCVMSPWRQLAITVKTVLLSLTFHYFLAPLCGWSVGCLRSNILSVHQ